MCHPSVSILCAMRLARQSYIQNADMVRRRARLMAGECGTCGLLKNVHLSRGMHWAHPKAHRLRPFMERVTLDHLPAIYRIYTNKKLYTYTKYFFRQADTTHVRPFVASALLTVGTWVAINAAWPYDIPVRDVLSFV